MWNSWVDYYHRSTLAFTGNLCVKTVHPHLYPQYIYIYSKKALKTDQAFLAGSHHSSHQHHQHFPLKPFNGRFCPMKLPIHTPLSWNSVPCGVPYSISFTWSQSSQWLKDNRSKTQDPQEVKISSWSLKYISDKSSLLEIPILYLASARLLTYRVGHKSLNPEATASYFIERQKTNVLFMVS